jgi:hypothetical protein
VGFGVLQSGWIGSFAEPFATAAHELGTVA